MKRIIAILLILTVSVFFAACGDAAPNASSGTSGSTAEESGKSPEDGTSSLTEQVVDTTENTSAEGTEPTDKDAKILIAYFSATGTTKKIAEYAADATGADLYEIVPATPYTSADLSYNSSNSRANTEMNDPSSRPEISGSVTGMENYDTVFIGYPIWFGEAPRIISTFMESYDFTGKTVVTFCTSGSSRLNDRSIQSLASGADWISGIRFSGNASKSDVSDWINGLGLEDGGGK